MKAIVALLTLVVVAWAVLRREPMPTAVLWTDEYEPWGEM